MTCASVSGFLTLRRIDKEIIFLLKNTCTHFSYMLSRPSLTGLIAFPPPAQESSLYESAGRFEHHPLTWLVAWATHAALLWALPSQNSSLARGSH